MNRGHFWKFVIVLAVLVWSFVEMYPPIGRDLAAEFESKAISNRKDAAFSNIVERLHQLQATNPQRTFANLVQAVDTNDIAPYFPMYATRIKEAPNPSRAILNLLQQDAAGKIKRGLDLQGGTAFVVGIKSNTVQNTSNAVFAAQLQQQDLSQAVEVMRRRVDKFGVAEPVIQPEGSDRILIQLPGLSEEDREAARANIQKAAFLQLRLVHPESDNLVIQGLSEPGYELLRYPHTDKDRRYQISGYLVKTKEELTGDYIRNVGWNRDAMGRPEITFSLNEEGAKIFGDFTSKNVGHMLAIVLDGELQSAPVIRDAIMGGNVQITGHYTDKEATDLRAVLENPLKVPVEVLSEYSVDPTLGTSTVKSGVNSAIIGTVAVAGFMVVYYLFAGFVADIALVTNIIILLGVMCAIPATFTLPGIAGVVLTIGMAVDANVLIFERIREESGKGKSLRGALAAGYGRAFWTIFDSHVTTLITSLILWNMGTGMIKGFGVTLTIGVAASLFTALVVTRLIFDFLIFRGWLKSLPMLHLIRVTNLDFMKLAKPAFIFTWVIILIGLSYGIFVRGNSMFGIEFAGGDATSLAFSQKIEQKQLTDVIARDAGVREPVIQYQKELGSGIELLRITTPVNTGEKVVEVLKKAFPDARFGVKGIFKVGPTVGKEIQQTAIIASLWSLLCILLYVAFRYEFSFAVGAVLAILHDVLFTIGCYCLTGVFGEGRQFNATMVAAVLTIIGFSINDTIVIFDRIREDLKLGVRGSFKDIINQALNQTLSRTLITSGTVFLATMSLYLFGGGAINDFAFTFLIGIITGTYSSIYIASALVLWWHKGVRPKASTQVTMEGAATARV
jgi:SecD/SecF fusion protein